MPTWYSQGVGLSQHAFFWQSLTSFMPQSCPLLFCGAVENNRTHHFLRPMRQVPSTEFIKNFDITIHAHCSFNEIKFSGVLLGPTGAYAQRFRSGIHQLSLG